MKTMTRTVKTEEGYLKEVTRAPKLIEGWKPCPKRVWSRAKGDGEVRYDPYPAKAERRAKDRAKARIRWQDRIRGKRYADCSPSTK